MAKVFSDRIIVSIDIGTTKICVLIGNQLDGEHVEILGVGKSPSDGLKKGVVVDIVKTIRSIKAAVKEAEIMAGIEVESAHIGISGGHIKSMNSHGVVPIKNGQVTEHDIANALEAAKAIVVPEGQQILHVLPQYFIIDGRDRVQDPVGMHGIRLEVEAHIIMGSIASVQNLVKCCENAGVKVQDIILEQLASADAVLSYDERELGVAVLDIGGGTSDLAIYQNGNIRHTMVLPVAGNHFTNDVAVGLRTTIKDAERIKREHGLASSALLKEDDLIEVEMVQGNQKNVVQLSQLVAILEPRAQEVLSLVHEEILKRRLQPLVTAGLVITGGGSLLRGIKEVASDIFSLPVRIGTPQITYDLPQALESPIYATGYGLLIHVLKKQKQVSIESLEGPLAKRILMRMKSWVSDFF